MDFTITAYQASFEAMVEQGRMKLLASLEKQRPESLKQVPTVSEAKSVRLGDFAYNIWGGFFVKKGTPEPIVARLREVIADSRNDPAAVAFRKTARSLEIPSMSGPELAHFFSAEVARMQALAQGVKLTLE